VGAFTLPAPGAERVGPGIPDVPAGTRFGIDIASGQAGIDLATFADAGGTFAIIKQGGANADDAPYVAPHYAKQLADARAAGLPVGHTWLNGQKKSIEDQAAFFVENVDIRPGDVIALDIDNEEATCTRAFTPDETALWIDEVRLQFPGIKVLLRMNLSVLRGADWSALTDQPLWVMNWDKNDGSIGEPPVIKWWQDWAIWQYSSAVRVPGFAGDVDGNIAKEDLFDKYGWVPQP
jgi:GH25 family lysozyme M1 (1,4-beta-N-acetylmuramidase)